MASFWCGLVLKTQKGLVLITWKGLITNILDSLLDLSFYASTKTCWVWWSDLFDYLLFQICWNLQVSRHHVCLHSGIDWLSVKSMWLFIDCWCLKELLCLLLCSGSCWHLNFACVGGRSIHHFFNSNCSFQMFTLHISYNLVSRPYAGLLGCTCDKWIFVMID